MFLLEKRQRINFLWDFYGEMLTRRQYEVIELYFKHDLSLGEISQELQISRQAAHNLIQRTVQSLEKMEKKLGLYERHLNQREELENILKELEKVETAGAENREKLGEAIRKLKELLEK